MTIQGYDLAQDAECALQLPANLTVFTQQQNPHALPTRVV